MNSPSQKGHQQNCHVLDNSQPSFFFVYFPVFFGTPLKSMYHRHRPDKRNNHGVNQTFDSLEVSTLTGPAAKSPTLGAQLMKKKNGGGMEPEKMRLLEVQGGFALHVPLLRVGVKSNFSCLKSWKTHLAILCDLFGMIK